MPPRRLRERREEMRASVPKSARDQVPFVGFEELGRRERPGAVEGLPPSRAPCLALRPSCWSCASMPRRASRQVACAVLLVGDGASDRPLARAEVDWAGHASAMTFGRTARGHLTVKVVPSASLDSTVMVPPCADTI